MSADKPQIELWSHIQVQCAGAFDLATSRLDSLILQAERLSKGRTMLNVGCGNGYLERAAQARHWQVVSVDPDQKSAEQVKAMGIDARCGSIESLPSPSCTFDVVICTEVFEHLTSSLLECGLNEVNRVLKPGGILIGTVPYREDLKANEVFCPHCNTVFQRWGHHQSFDESTLESILARSLEVRSVRPAYFVPWSLVNWKGKLLWFARVALSWMRIYGAGANIFFVAAKNR